MAPFNIDVTTERPGTLHTRTAVALITRRTDANGDPNPYNTGGGVAYVNVFGTTSYAQYRPAWIYHDNLSNNESYIAEAASHEVGHNLGLSHDGTSSSEYYGGHGSGDISWGPLMGTGYNCNVSQWSKGEYYLANNTQDDLATLAGKMAYRTDDHGNTPGTATALVITGGTTIAATTPENDSTNANQANKGVLERNTDVDVFSFVTGSGAVQLAVKPWLMPAGTRGGNSDILLDLYNEAGVLLASSNPASQTTALIQTSLAEGRYYLYVRNSGSGNPLISPPTGYTSYASLGQYFISGSITEPIGFIVPPVAEGLVADLTQSGQSTQGFTVTYSDNLAINVATLDSNDIQVTGPNGFAQLAKWVSGSSTTKGTPRSATYAVTPPNGSAWLPAHNGTYTLTMQGAVFPDFEEGDSGNNHGCRIGQRMKEGSRIRPIVGDFNPRGTIKTVGIHGRSRSGSRLNGIWAQSDSSPMSCSGLRIGRSSRYPSFSMRLTFCPGGHVEFPPDFLWDDDLVFR